MNVESFLSKAALKIISQNYTGPKSVVILPNRRSEVFLKQEIRKINSENIWLPDFLPIDEFFQKVAGLRKSDNVTTWFELFDIYKKIESVNAKKIDEFLTWAPMIINDFNDIDNSMADAKTVYSQLSAIKAIEQWNTDGRPLTEMQENYIRFYNSMYDFYEGLVGRLKSMDSGYQGLINRYLAENLDSKAEDIHWNKFLIIGINALSESEIRVFEYINQNFNAEFLWDIDDYYFNLDKNGSTHEAGKHIRKIIERLKLKPQDQIESNLIRSAKTIRVFGVPKNIGQVKFMGQELSKQSDIVGRNTAIVLGNEGLLIPLLNSLPDIEGGNKYNLTLGYPLANSQADYFFSSWIDLIDSIDNQSKRIVTNRLIKFIDNPIVKQLLDIHKPVSDRILKSIITQNTLKISFIELTSLLNEIDKTTSQTVIDLLNNFETVEIHKGLENIKNFLTSFIEIAKSKNLLFGEQLHALINIIGKLVIYTNKYSSDINLQALKKISKQFVSQKTINLIGEPLQGIQIMGMLETRNLDFENIYILSTNEGILPKTTSVDSFIPLDVRRELSLPLPSDKTDIYSYHFFRLLQRSTNVTLIYNSDSDKLGGGEKSRFILQIENELCNSNHNINLLSTIIDTEIAQGEYSTSAINNITINKTDDILLKIADISRTGYSASLLISYITCGLKFYFQKILELKTSSSFDQSIEANTFGTVIHEALEDIYKPQLNTELNTEFISAWIGKTDKLLLSKFNKNFKVDNLNSGKNLLIFEVAKNYITNFLKWEIKNLKSNPSILLSVEETIVTKIYDGNVSLNVKGTLDKVEKIGLDNSIRITDYKTGYVQQSSLKISDLDKLFSDPKMSKAFQVLFYAWLYKLKYPDKKIESGILSIRKLSNGYMPLIIKDIENISDYFTDFEKAVFKLVREISDPNIQFVQTNDPERCKYCDYKTLCNMPF